MNAIDAREEALQECWDIADKAAMVFGDLMYERCAKDIRAQIELLMKKEPK